MEKISLKVIIAGRTYPLTINREEESAITAAAEKINTNIKKLQGNYAVKDMQDLLAMTALQLALQKPETVTSVESDKSPDPSIEQGLSKILSRIEEQL
jgi:cell division protein ZapA (FtsZ GTPase activity inhibitor)